jgi:hypothetical protein
VIENPKPGEHTLRVTLAGKKDNEQKVTVAAGKDSVVRATLAEPEQPAIAARIVVETLPYAEVCLDGEMQGKTSADGRLVIENPKPGEHALRVKRIDKRDYVQKVTVEAGRELVVKASLQDPRGLGGLGSKPGTCPSVSVR